MTTAVDLVIAGSGFAGSLMAMIARQLGLSVVLLEQGSHPRMAIGESTTPLSNLLLERLSARYNLPQLAPLAKWGSWQDAYPQVACGLKRGFSFFHEDGDPLLVAASPNNTIADTHWYRADVDHFLVGQAQRLGVDYRDHARIERVAFAADGATIAGSAGGAPFDLHAGLILDATGPRGWLYRALALEEARYTGFPLTESLYSHFTGVEKMAVSAASPYPVDDAAVHHVFPGGWVWVLRFNNGVTSAGVAATCAVARSLRLSEGEPAWRRLLESVPALRSQFRGATACSPFRHQPTVSFRSQTIAGARWAMLPSAAGFVDPLLSSGFALTFLGIERLAAILETRPDTDALAFALQQYARQTDEDLLAVSRLISALYATMGNFAAFTAVSFLYFAAVSFAESALRLGKPELAAGFLLDQHPGFGPGARRLLERAHSLQGAAETQAFQEEVVRFIEPFNIGGFGRPERGNTYAVLAEDLFAAAPKLGASSREIAAMLARSGFSPQSAVQAII